MSEASLLSELITFIRSSYSPEEKVKVAQDGSQTIFFRKSGKSLCYINIKEAKSTVTVVIGASLNDKVSQADISQKAKDVFLNAKQFHDGKWLFFELNSGQDLKDIQTLLTIKRSPYNTP